MHRIQIIVLLFSSFSAFGQKPFREIIETDSSHIEIRSNSIYRCYEETYKNKDSIWRSVSFIDDTTKLNTEGWRRKNGTRIGKWSEYDRNGIWLYTIDYDNDTWNYNKSEYPFQYLLDSMKIIADKIIIDKYGIDFFRNNVRFKFHGSTSIEDSVTYATGTYWTQREYLGSWTNPIKKKPNSFVLNYIIRLDDNHFYYNMLVIRLDSLGKLNDGNSLNDVTFNDRKQSKYSIFNLTYDKAMEICHNNGLSTTISEKTEANLRFGWNINREYAGEYYFEVAEQYDQKIDGECPTDCIITTYYNIWRINPWSSELIFHEKMMKISKWKNGHGVGGLYTELDK